MNNEHHGVPDMEAAGHQRWRVQPPKTLARGFVQTTGLFQGQNRLIKEEKFNLNIHDVSIYMAGTVQQICHISPRTFKADPFTMY
jgi:hypothetical protein